MAHETMDGLSDQRIMKFSGCLLLVLVVASGCRTPQAPANPRTNARAKAILHYFQGLEARSGKRVVSGQFSNFGDGANVQILSQIHDQAGHWPALLGADYAGRGGIATEAPNRAVLAYWQRGGLVTIS